MKTKNFFAGHSSSGRAERFKKMKNFFKNLMPMFLLVAGLGISPNAWAGYTYSNISNAKIVGNMPTCSWSDGSGWQLNSSDKNKWDGTFYIPHSSSNYEFDIWLKSDKDNWSGNRANCGFWFTSTNKEAWTLSCTPGSNMQIQCITKPASGYIKVFFEFYCSYSGGYGNDSKLWVEQWAVSPLDGSMNPSTTSVASGSQLNMNPSLSGGSGSYNKSYSADPNIGSFDGDNYKAPMVLSNTNVTITLEVSDANGQLSGLAHKTITKTITVTPPTGDLYIKHPWSTGADGAWSWQKMTKVSDGNYKFSGNYGGSPESVKGCNINTSESDDGALYFGSGSGLVVSNSPALNDKCWFTLSYSAGTLTVAPKTYTLTLDGDGGTPASQDVTVTYGKACPSFTTPTRTGYTYGGFLKPNTTTTLIINSGSQTFAANESGWTSSSKWIHDDNATIKAKWTAKNITIKFDANNGTGTAKSDIATKYDATITLPSNDFTRTGYAPNGWNTKSDGTGTHYNSGASVKNINEGGTITLYAEWTPNQTTVTLDKNGGDGDNKQFTATFDALINVGGLTPHERTGYTLQQYDNESADKVLNADLTARSTDLDGWVRRKTVSSVTNSYWANPNESATLYAKWKANQYTITLHYNDGTENTGTKTVTFDATATAVPKPTYGDNVFNGYFTQATGGVQVINADGAFLTNVDGYTSNGNWVRASDVDLYAQWTTRTACTITYGVTDGTQAVSTRGTIRAKVGDGAYTNMGSLDVYTGDVVTIEYSPKSGQYYTSNNGYEANGWYDAVSGGSSLPATHKNDYTFTVTGSASVYVKADPVVYTISTAVNPASTTQYPEGAGTVTPTSGEAGPDIALELIAAEQVGYDWVNWTLNDETNGKIVTGTETDKTISVAAKAAGFTATANFSAHNYTITYNLDGGTNYDGAPATYTIETATINLGTPTKTDYTFDGWFDAATGGSQVTQITQGSTGDKILWARWHETLHNVNIVPGTGIESTTPQGATNVGNVNPVGISAEVATGYTWSQWTSSNANVTIANPSLSSTTIKATGEGTVTATATEILLPLTTSANESHMGSVDKTASSIGVATTSQLTATAKNRNYKFKQWNLTNCTITSGTVNDATITIKGDGINTPSAEAEFEVAWYVNGDDVFSGWGTNGHQMTEQSEGVFTVTINVTKIASANTDFGCKIYNASQNWYYEYNNTEGDGWWFTRENPSTTIGHNNKTNMRLRSDMVGDYTFTLDCSTSRDNPTLTVSFPGESSRTVTVETEAGSKDVEVFEATQTALVADQYVNGLRFDRWVVTNSAGDDKSSSITINTPTSYSTHMKNATEDGLIVKATYTSHGIIYFKNNPGWSDVKVYFYTEDYFDQTYGTGCLSEGKDDNRKANGYGMTHLANTDIWYYDWQSAGLSPRTSYVAFTVNLQTEAQWFDENQVVYRGDWHDEAPLFVPYNYIHRYLNKHNDKQTCYYDEGLWMKYNSTESGYDIRGDWSITTWAKLDAQSFKATSPGSYEFTTEMINLPGNDTKHFKVFLSPASTDFNNFGTDVGFGDEVTSSHPYTKVYENKNDATFKTTAGAGYIFKLSLGDGQIIVSVEYPLSEGDYQVVSVTEGKVHSNGIIYKQGAEASLASFFIEKGKTTELRLQKCSTIVDNKPVWENIDVTYAIPQTMETGIYNFRINPLATNPTIENLNQVYSGKYYIRTDGLDGGWESYQTNADNEMYDYGSMLDAGVTYDNFPYNYYKTKWIKKDKNVKFTIANDYSKCISDSLVGDAIIGDEVMTLPEDANVRFMWNSETNKLSRAYISGSTDITDRFLVLEGDAKMFDKDGKALTDAGGGKILGLDDYELNFDDKNNWVYQADIKAQPGCAVKLTAKYNSQVQYFIGAAGDEEDSRKTIIDGTSESSTKYTMRAVYDFKTNRLVAGWIPDNEPISGSIVLGGDMLLVREHQGNASQITFGATGSVSDIHHIYSVLTIKKDTMLGKDGTEYTTAATNTDYKRTMYWISFPFDVKISEVFGVDGYGKKWIMQRYNGEKRAEIGWFQETETFWEYLAPTSTLKAYKGYLLILNANYFNTDGADVWKNSATEANFYFPSAEKNIGIINKSFVEIEVHAHECKINRPFADNSGKNHTITDSYWNVIGVPAFQDAPAEAAPVNDDFKSYYEWVPATNTYSAKPVDVGEVTFKTMHAYMVQFGGTLKWTDVSVVNNPAPAPYAYADAKNYRIELFFNGNGAEDHTYINLADGASTDFVLNEDMMKIDNAGQPNIYSFAGAYDVAYNETKMENQSIMLGVSAPKDGSYTFAMPKDFSGKAVLVDLESGEATDLNLSNYTVELNKGTYNNRFQLLLEVEAKAPTAIDNAKGEWSVDGKTKKLFINDNIYLINAGRIYNASGTKVR